MHAFIFFLILMWAPMCHSSSTVVPFDQLLHDLEDLKITTKISSPKQQENLPYENAYEHFYSFYCKEKERCTKQTDLQRLSNIKENLEATISYKAMALRCDMSVFHVTTELDHLSRDIRGSLLGELAFHPHLFIYAKACIDAFPFQGEKKYHDGVFISTKFLNQYPY